MGWPLRCDRCWSEEAVQPYAGPGLLSPGDVSLCGSCSEAAPTHPILFDRLFLRFASRKEMLRHYRTSKVEEAARRWCEEERMDWEDAVRALGEEGRQFDLLKASDLTRAAEEGLPYGYTSRGGSWEPSKAETETVTEIFRRYAAGDSLATIASRLERRGVPTKRGGAWHPSTVRYILRNPLYAGRRRSKGGRWEGSHPALVDGALFAKVQRRLEARRRRPDQRAPDTPLRA